MHVRFIYITTKDKKQAHDIGQVLVAERLVACVNILDGMESIYWWEGKIQKGNEAVLIAKTTREKVRDVINRVKELHTYECPCVVSLPVESGNENFLKWILDQVH